MHQLAIIDSGTVRDHPQVNEATLNRSFIMMQLMELRPSVCSPRSFRAGFGEGDKAHILIKLVKLKDIPSQCVHLSKQLNCPVERSMKFIVCKYTSI